MGAGENTIKTYAQFQADPALQKEFGSYTKYLDSISKKLGLMSAFNFATQGYSNIPLGTKESLFFNARHRNIQAGSVEKEQKQQSKLEEKLDKIKDPKVRAQIEEELSSKSLSDELFELLMERYDKKKEEFEKIWNEYLELKQAGIEAKARCERLLAKYRNSESSTDKSNYLKAYNEYSDLALDRDLALDMAGEIAHRPTYL